MPILMFVKDFVLQNLWPIVGLITAVFVVTSLYMSGKSLAPVSIDFGINRHERIPSHLIHAMAKCAQLAYRQLGDFNDDEWRRRLPERLRLDIPDYGFDYQTLKFHCGSGIECFSVLSADHSEGIVSIRGTSDLLDAIQDGMACKLPQPIGAAHSGFAENGLFLFRKLGLQERMLEFPDTRWSVTGHSKGAGEAQACLYYAELAADQHAGVRFQWSLLLCAPRFGNAELANYVNDRFGRRIRSVVVCRDLVCLVPPKFMGYRDIGEPAYFDRNLQFHSQIRRATRLFDFAASLISDLVVKRRYGRFLAMHNCETAAEKAIEHKYEF